LIEMGAVVARSNYGGGADDVIVSPVTISSTQVAGLPASQSFQVWNLTNTAQLTGIQDSSGTPLASDLVVSSGTGAIPQFKGPDNYVGPLRLKHVGSGTSWIVQPNLPTLPPDTVVVAASTSQYQTDYRCDGTADEVQIQAAIDAVKAAGGGTVLLTAGTFNIAAPVLVEGYDDVDVEQDLYLRGAGPKNTTLAVTAGVNCGIRLGKCVRAHVSDLGLTIDGSSDGIQAVASTEVAGIHRSAWLSTISRIQVKGPFDGGDTGWAFDLDNVFRATISEIEVNGTTNGLRFYSSNSAFNPGDLIVARCFVDIANGASGGVAYKFESSAGNANQYCMITCHGIGSGGSGGQYGWQFTGAGATSHIRTIDCNAEQFQTTVQVGATAYDIDVDLVHVTVPNGGTLADFDGYGNRVRCGLAYIPASATVTLVDDDNTYSAKPNIFGPVDIYADTGSTVNVDVADTVLLRDITSDGPGTVSASLRMPPAVTPVKVATLTDAATIAINAALGNHFRVTTTANRALGVPTNPTDGQRIIVEHIASGGARTLSLTTGSTGAFQFASTGITGLTATNSGTADFLEFVYSASLARWRIVNVSKG
jgi:hypothetical protein